MASLPVTDAGPGVPACRTIGFITPVAHGYYFGNVLAGVVDAAAVAGGRVIAIQAYAAGMRLGSLREDPFLAPVAWEHIDAFVVAGEALDDSYVRTLSGTGKPIIFISPENVDLSYATVVPDNRGGIAAAIEHLVGHGHRRIAYAARTPAVSDDAVRLQAYRDEMRTRGLRPYEPVTVSWRGEDPAADAAVVRELVSLDEPPTAIVSSTDVAALALLDALKAAGVVVPRDMAVVGFDDIEDAALHQPSLTTISQSFTLKGRLAGELAIGALEGRPAEPGYHYSPVSLVTRESCGCPERHVAAALSRAAGGGASACFVQDFVHAAHDDCELTQIRRGGLTAVGQRVLDLFTATAGSATSGMAADGMTAKGAGVSAIDLEQAITAVAAATLQLAPQTQSILRVVALLRRFAREYAAELGRPDPAMAARLADLAHDLSMAIIEQQMRSRPEGLLQFQLQRRHYGITTDLLRRDNRDSRSLAWLSRTEIRAGCFAVWDGERGDPAQRSALRVLGTYHESGSFQAVGERCDVRSFPPAPLLDLIGERPGEVMYLLSVRFDGSDWGFLALIGPLETRDDTNMIEMFNHWAVMLTVALDQEQAVREVRLSAERYALAAEAANDGLWDWDASTRTMYYSTRWKALLGYADDEISATVAEALDRIHPVDRPVLDRILADGLQRRSSTLEYECRMRASDGGYRWMLIRARSVRDGTGHVIRMVGSMTDVTERRLLEDQLRHDALYDALTGLPNRTLFLDRLNQAIEDAKRSSDDWFAVVFLDLNGFKVINDSLGHQVGDQVLVKVAERLGGQMRANDTVSRFGGDEFVVLLKDLHTLADLPAVVERILTSVSRPLSLGNRSLTVGAVAGIAVSLIGYETADDFLRDADTAMYRAKAIGSGASVLFDESMHVGAMARLHLESDLHRAIAEEQFELWFQPVLELATRRIVGLEAMIRWNHPTRGLVLPGEFLPVAEVTGLSQQLGRWTVREACRRAREWRVAAPACAGIPICVNLSHHQFWDPELRPYLLRELRRHEVPAATLVLEVTEGVIMNDPTSATELMRQLHDDGFALYLDDFGTGHSSLEVIHNFPIDTLKVDRSFVARISSDARSRELVRFMTAMGQNLGIEVIAEGVETDDQATALAEVGCRYVQGYLFSRPVPASRIPDLLTAGVPAAPELGSLR